jgi:hypothetical protein
VFAEQSSTAQMRLSLLNALISIIVVLSLNACSTADLSRETSVGATGLEHITQYDEEHKFNPSIVTCVMILPTRSPQGSTDFSRHITASLTRHAYVLFDRVAPPDQLGSLSQTPGGNFRTRKGITTISIAINCPYVLLSRVVGPGMEHFVAWARIRYGVEALLLDLSHNHVLWRSRLVLGRGSGDMPMSPIGVISGIITSVTFAENSDIEASIADDAVRRLMRSLSP